MKVVLSVAENWHRRYLVEIPDGTPAEKWDEEAIKAYSDAFQNGGLGYVTPDVIDTLGTPEYIDDGPTSAHLVTGKYEEEYG